mmetsp:Transcript_35285/g.92860  ORF Transcript_35285/g.92860 Transcript_35285/m.92860 type:complete len:146 (+) Transcript_35285:92-529(+)
MKGVMSQPSNFKRPFSPVDFAPIVEAKMGRTLNESLKGVGHVVPAGLPSDVRYNERAQAMGLHDLTMAPKGFNNAFPYHTGYHSEGYLQPRPVPKFGGLLPNSPERALDPTRPSFEKWVERDGAIRPGQRPRDLTLYNKLGGLSN